MEAFERLESLLLTQSYDDLSTTDQIWVSEQGITRQAYEQQAEALTRTKRVLDTEQPMPPHGLKENLIQQQRLRGHALRKTRLTQLSRLAAVFLIGLGIGWGIWGITPEPEPGEVVLQLAEDVQTFTDTIYIEKRVQANAPVRTVLRERIVHDTIFINAVASASQEELQREILGITQPEEVTDFSRNAQQTEELLKFVVEVY